MDTGTNETMIWPHWEEAVIMGAVAKGASGEVCRSMRDMLRRWYLAGEPVWMAVDSLAFAAKERAKARPMLTAREELRAAIAFGRNRS